MFYRFCLVIFQVSVPNFTVPSPKKLEQMVMENFERIRVSTTTKLSDIQSLSVVVDEWKCKVPDEWNLEEYDYRELKFQTLSCTAITKLYEQFMCFLGCKVDSKFSSHDILKKCKEHIPEFQSKVTKGSIF
jgi:hypothetical protein